MIEKIKEKEEFLTYLLSLSGFRFITRQLNKCSSKPLKT